MPYLFVDGPRHGEAAGAIARLLGLDPNRYPETYSWARFYASLQHGPLHRELVHHRGLARKVALLAKIASEPEAQRLSSYSQGGTPAGIYRQTVKLFCENIGADPGSILVINTYFLHPLAGACPSPAALQAAGPRFRSQIDAMAAATGNRRAVFLLEVDGVGSSRCIQKVGSLGLWEADLRYEAQKVAALPHTVVYLEGGYADGNSPGYTAQVLNAAGVRQVRGFFTNDTQQDWTISEVRWAQRVSRLTGGAHFIVNTATNGAGPMVPRGRVRYGNEVLCNPPGRGIGPRPTTATGFTGADAFLWTSVPGNSSGSCNGGTAAGTFWTGGALAMAARANGRLGPGYPSRPY